jgi:hypothetical protein
MKYLQEIKCQKCGLLMGYAPYGREEYLCCQCNGPVTDADFEDDEADE